MKHSDYHLFFELLEQLPPRGEGIAEKVEPPKEPPITPDIKKVYDDTGKELSELDKQSHVILHINYLLNRVLGGAQTECKPDDTSTPGYTFDQFKKDAGSDNKTLAKGDKDAAITIIYNFLEINKSKPSYIFAIRKAIISYLWDETKKPNGRFAPNEIKLLMGEYPDKDKAFDTWLNTPQRYTLALFWHALIFDRLTTDCPVPELQDLCEKPEIVKIQERTREWLYALREGDELLEAISTPATDKPEGKVLAKLLKYMTSGQVEQDGIVSELGPLQKKYNYQVRKEITTDPSSAPTYIQRAKAKDRQEDKDFLPFKESINTPITTITNDTKRSHLYTMRPFHPFVRKADQRITNTMSSIAISMMPDLKDPTAQAPKDSDFIQKLSENNSSFDFVSMCFFLYSCTDKSNPSYQQRRQFKDILTDAERDTINTLNIGSLNEVGALANGKHMIFPLFQRVATAYIKQLYNTKVFGAQFTNELRQIDDNLSGLSGLLKENLGSDKIYMPSNMAGVGGYTIETKHVKYPDQEIKTSINSHLSTIFGSVTNIATITNTPGVVIDPTLQKRYRSTMVQVFLAMSGLDPKIQNIDALPKDELNAFSAILKTGGYDMAPYMIYFSDYINNLDAGQLFQFAQSIVQMGIITGNDEYDPMEKAIFLKLMPQLYLTIGKRMIDIYTQLPTEESAKKEQMYDMIVEFAWIISGRNKEGFRGDKYKTDKPLTLSLTDALLINPGLKYLVDLFQQVDKIDDLPSILISSDSAATLLESLFQASGKFDQALTHNTGTTLDSVSMAKYEAFTKSSIPGLDTNLKHLENYPWGSEQFHNKLMGLGFFNLGLNFFLPTELGMGYKLATARDPYKQDTSEKRIMDFYANLSEGQLTELCLLNELMKNPALSSYLFNNQIQSADQASPQTKDAIQALSGTTKTFDTQFQKAYNQFIVDSFKANSTGDTLSDSGVALYYNIIGGNKIKADFGSITLPQQSDASVREQRGYVKTTATILGGIAVGLGSFGIGSALSLSTFGTALLLGSTGTVYSEITRADGRLDPNDKGLDLASQFLANTATAYFGLQYFTPGAGVLSQLKNPKFLAALKFALADCTIGLSTEFGRQKVVSHFTKIEDINWTTIVTQGGLMLLLSLLGASIGHIQTKKLQGETISQGELNALESGMKLADGAGSPEAIQAELASVLIANGVPKDKAKQTATKLWGEREKAKKAYGHLTESQVGEGGAMTMKFEGVTDVTSAKAFITELCSTDGGKALLRILIDSEVTPEATRYNLRYWIANASPTDRSDIAKSIFNGLKGDSTKWNKAQRAMDNAHKIGQDTYRETGEYTLEEMQNKIKLLKTAVNEGVINLDIMKTWLRLNVCGEQIGNYYQHLILIADPTGFPPSLLKHGVFADATGWDYAKKGAFPTDFKVAYNHGASDLCRKNITLTTLASDGSIPIVKKIGANNFTVEYKGKDFQSSRGKLSQSEAQKICDFLNNNKQDEIVCIKYDYSRDGKGHTEQFLVPKSYLKLKTNRGGKTYSYQSQLAPSISATSFNGASDIDNHLTEFNQRYGEKGLPMYNNKIKLEKKDGFMEDLESIFEGADTLTLTQIEVRWQRVIPGSKIHIEKVTTEGRSYIRVEVDRYNPDDKGFVPSTFYYHRFEIQ